jgi:hypothetical protein
MGLSFLGFIQFIIPQASVVCQVLGESLQIAPNHRAPVLPKPACSVTYSLDATWRLQPMTLLDGFLVALNIIVLMMWVWRRFKRR